MQYEDLKHLATCLTQEFPSQITPKRAKIEFEESDVKESL